jgi:antitoxin component of MazEF toxin-antitoxin module
MFHRHFCAILLVPALGAAVAIPAAAQASDKQKICSQVQNREASVGTWASYNWTGGQTGGSTMRMAVVGTEPHEGTTFYWYEMTIDDPKRPQAKMIIQTLVPGLAGTGRVRAVIMKTGDQPAMRLPPQMIQMINNTPGMNMPAELARQCLGMEVVGWESVTVPAGQFRALHMRTAARAMVSDVWVQPDLQFAMVKSILKDGGVMELAGQGSGAKSSITETPVEMPGLPGASPPR